VTKISGQKASRMANERVILPKKKICSRRVEIVIARIFAKDRAHTKQRSLRRSAWEHFVLTPV